MPRRWRRRTVAAVNKQPFPTTSPIPPWAPAEGLTAQAARPVGRPLLSQRWTDVTFLHWPVRPGLLDALMPPGVRVDTFDGWSYVGLVPFRMRDLGLGRGPALPWVGTFGECNVRLYTVDRQGRRGVLFLTLECSRAAACLTARLGLGLPYRWSRISHTVSGEVHRWRTDGLPPGGRRRLVRLTAEVTDVDATDDIDRFLTNRWGLHTRHAGRTWYLPTEHDRWPLRRLRVVSLRQTLTSACGLPGLSNPVVHAAWASAVQVRFGAPSPVC